MIRTYTVRSLLHSYKACPVVCVAVCLGCVLQRVAKGPDSARTLHSLGTAPPQANRYMIVNVAFVEQIGLLRTGAPLAMVLVSSEEPGPPGQAHPFTWLVTFADVAAYRCSDIVMWHGPRQYRDESSKRLEVALWEVVDSEWLPMAVSANRPAHLPVRHYVIASSFRVFEIAAGSWESRPLGPWMQVRNDLEVRWMAMHPDGA